MREVPETAGRAVWPPATRGAPGASAAPPPAPGLGSQWLRAVEIVRSHLLLVFALTVLALAATGLLLAREALIYRATAVLRLADARRAVTTGIEEVDAPQERLTSPLLSQIQLLRSRTLASAVVDTLGLRLRVEGGLAPGVLDGVVVRPDHPADTLRASFGPAAVAVRSRAGSATAPYGRRIDVGGVSLTVAARPAVERALLVVEPRERAVDRVLGSLKVAPRMQTNVVDVSFTADDPEVAQRTLNEVMVTFQRMSARAAQEQSRRRRRFLEGQLAQSDSALDAARATLTSFRRETRLFSSRERLEGAQREYSRLEEQRTALEAERRVFRTLLVRAAEGATARREALRDLMAWPGVAGDPLVAPLLAQLHRHRAAHDSLTTGEWRSAPTHPDVQRLTTLIASTEEQIVGVARSRVASLEARLAALDDVSRQAVGTIRSLPGVESEERRLIQLVDERQRLDEQLRAEYQKARMAEAVELGPVEVIDLAALPTLPQPPLRGLKLALGLCFGLALGIAGAFLRELHTPVIRRKEELERILHLPSLGVIPKLSPIAAAGDAAAPPSLSARHRLRDLLDRPKTASANEASLLVTMSAMPNAGTEAYRVLRTNLLFARHSGGFPRSILVTSAAPGEGKTITAANLAVTLAREGMRVLLVDCDLRRARLHRLFGVPRQPGLTQLLRASSTPPGVVCATTVAGLFVLPGGAAEASSAELLASSLMRRLLGALTTQFDIVVLDAPPVLSLADASILGALVDAVLLVVRAGQTDRGAAQEAAVQLAAVGATILGTVLNDPRGEAPEYLRYYATYAVAH